MKLSYAERMAATQEKLENPSVGDSFQEHLTYWVWVLEVTDTHVTYADTVGCEERYKKRTGNTEPNTRCDLPDDLRLVTVTREEFKSNPSGTMYQRTDNVEGWLDKLKTLCPEPTEDEVKAMAARTHFAAIKSGLTRKIEQAESLDDLMTLFVAAMNDLHKEIENARN